MKLPAKIIFLNIVLTIVLTIIITPIQAEANFRDVQRETEDKERVIAAYFSPSHFQLKRKYLISDLEYNKLTHLFYGSFEVDEDCVVQSSSIEEDYHLWNEKYQTRGNLETIRKIKEEYPSLKVIFSLTSKTNPEDFKKCLHSKKDRHILIQSLFQFQQYNIDGVNYDWDFSYEEPVYAEDAFQFYTLVKETSLVFKNSLNLKKRWLLTMTGSIQPRVYELLMKVGQNLNYYIDLINLKAFGYPSLTDFTYLNAPLEEDKRIQRYNLSIETTIRRYYQIGFQKGKMVLAISAYGNGWKGTAGLYKKNSGELEGAEDIYNYSYPEVKEYFLSNAEYKKYEAFGVPYLYNEQDQTLISYDDPKSVYLKSKYAFQNELAGVVLYKGQFDPENELFNAMWKGAHGKRLHLTLYQKVDRCDQIKSRYVDLKYKFLHLKNKYVQLRNEVQDQLNLDDSRENDTFETSRDNQDGEIVV